ncbi:pectinesterase [Salmonella enterica subsp. enterica serovar Choleraesuis]|nr:pectinesterase [Salmonella enterica subsp. enterica serovar Choleraesuis]
MPFSVSRLAIALALGTTLSACSFSSDQSTSSQQAPGSATRPILNGSEAENFTAARYFQALDPQAAAWTPGTISTPGQADIVVGPAGTEGVNYHTLQDAVDAAITKHTSQRITIAVMPGEYPGTVYIPAASSSLTIYGTGNQPSDVKIGQALDATMDPTSWRQAVNPGGKYMPGKPSWYMYQTCLNNRSASIGLMCSAAVWSQNNGLQLQNLTIENSLGDSVDAGDHPAVALRSDGDKVQLNKVNLLGRQNTFLVTNSDLQNRFINNRQPRTLVSHSYIEGDVDLVSGRGAVVFDDTRFQVVNSRTQKEAYVFAPATQSGIYYGFLAVNSHFYAAGDGVAQLGRAWDMGAGQNGYQPGQTSNGQVVIRDSDINDGFNHDHPWGNAKDSGRAFSGNVSENRDLNDPNANRMWEYNNTGTGSN